MVHVAYLAGTYPTPSQTFIRREIEELERHGAHVARFSVRRWDGTLVDKADQEEQRRTTVLLTGNSVGLLAALFRETLANPLQLARAARIAAGLAKAARGGALKHVAYLLEAIALRDRLKTLGIEHLHVHFSGNAASVALLARALGGPPFSFTVHGPDELMDPTANAIEQKIEKAKATIAISRYCERELQRYVPAGQWDQIRVIRCGVQLDNFPSPAAGWAPSTEIVCVGRLCPQKGQIHIPAAIAMLKDRFPDLRVTLLGDGESRAAIEAEIVRHNVGRNMKLLGWASNDEVRAAITRSRALLLPSFAEGLPVVIMEAFALGRPVITSDVAGIPELVDASCGWIVRPGDVDSLANALAEAMDAPADKLAAMGAEGRRRVESMHDLRQNAGQLLTIFQGSTHLSVS
jgi:glycosyltransferase involved in cell wall biosynthesis